MSKVIDDIKTQMIDFASRFGPSAIVEAFVSAVNDDNTVDVTLLDESVIQSVKLRAVLSPGGNMFLLVPAFNSVVLIGRINNSDETVVLSVSEITEVKAIIDTVTYDVNTNGFLLQKGADTLKQALTLIVQSVQQIMVLYGNNPDFVKLANALTIINNIFQ